LTVPAFSYLHILTCILYYQNVIDLVIKTQFESEDYKTNILTALTPEADYDQTPMGLPPVKSVVLFIHHIFVKRGRFQGIQEKHCNSFGNIF
jgi:hypothetical protein